MSQSTETRGGTSVTRLERVVEETILREPDRSKAAIWWYTLLKCLLPLLLLLGLLIWALTRPATDTTTANLNATSTAIASVPTTLQLPGGSLAPGNIALSGTAAPNADVEILNGGQVVGKTKAAADGKWSFNLSLPQAGSYDLTARSLSSDGKPLSLSSPAKLNLNLTTTIAATPITFDLPGGGNVSTGEINFSGTAAPNTDLDIVVNGQVVGKAKAGADGKWSYKYSANQPGSLQLEARPVGQTAGGSKALSLSVTTAATTVAATTSAANAVTTAAQAGQTPVASPPASLTVLALPAISLELPNNGTVALGNVTFNGTSTSLPNTELEFLLDGKVLGKTRTGADGKWSYQATDLKPGKYQAEVRTVAQPGQPVITSKPVPLTVASIEIILPESGTISAGQNSITGLAIPGADLELLSNGQVLSKTKVGADGKWSYTGNFTPGKYEIDARTLTPNIAQFSGFYGRPVILTVL